MAAHGPDILREYAKVSFKTTRAVLNKEEGLHGHRPAGQRARRAGHVVRRVLLRRNIAIDAETAQLVAAAVQAALELGMYSGRHAGVRAFPPPAANAY